MRMSLQYQYMLDMEKERSQMASFKCYDFAAIHISLSQQKHASNMAGEHIWAEPKLKVTP